MHTGGNERAFTILELLVAVAVASVVFAAVYGAYFSISSSSTGLYKKMKDSSRSLAFLSIIRREIESAYYSPLSKATAFVIEERDIYGRSASRLSFASFSKDGAKTITYFAEEKGDRLVLRKTIREITGTTDPVTYTVARDIDGFSVRVLDKDFEKAYDSSVTGGLPGAVRVELSYKDGRASDMQFCTTMVDLK